jgi:hypothetical protein
MCAETDVQAPTFNGVGDAVPRASSLRLECAIAKKTSDETDCSQHCHYRCLMFCIVLLWSLLAATS